MAIGTQPALEPPELDGIDTKPAPPKQRSRSKASAWIVSAVLIPICLVWIFPFI